MLTMTYKLLQLTLIYGTFQFLVSNLPSANLQLSIITSRIGFLLFYFFKLKKFFLNCIWFDLVMINKYINER